MLLLNDVDDGDDDDDDASMMTSKSMIHKMPLRLTMLKWGRWSRDLTDEHPLTYYPGPCQIILQIIMSKWPTFVQVDVLSPWYPDVQVYCNVVSETAIFNLTDRLV